MDQNTNTSHLSNGPGVANSYLCNKSTDGGENSANVLDNNGNYMNSSKNKISPSKPKIPKRMKENEENETEMAAVALNHEQSPDIYKLPIELLADTFDYLPLQDLCAIRQTSKWFNQVAGLCYQRNYSTVVIYNRNRNRIDLSAFHELIQAVDIRNECCMHRERFPNVRFTAVEFKQLRKIAFRCLNLAYDKIEDFKEILDKIEYLTIYACKYDKNFSENIPFLFPNLKSLKMLNRQPRSEWIVCKYPKLERFELTSVFEENVAIGPFLEINPNIRKLAIDALCLWNNREAMRAAKLEDLAIRLDNSSFGTDCPFIFAFFCQLLNELHELGTYKRLEIYLYGYCDRNTHQIIELSSLHTLNKLQVNSLIYDARSNDKTSERFALSTFKNLEQIDVPLSYSINDIEATADNLKNLERIQFVNADLNDIIIFIKRSRKLTKIKVKHFVHTASRINKTKEKIIYNGRNTEYLFEKQKVINLSSLNAERAKLTNAKRVTLYVMEEVYLATKWAMKETDFEFIQLKRFESFEWDDDFSRNQF